MFSGPQYSHRQGLGRVAVSAAFIGAVWGAHACLLALQWGSYGTRVWSVYVILLSSFHMLEFILTAYGQPGSVSADSFLLNHSRAYSIAVVTGWAEYALELMLLPTWKTGSSASFCMSVLGVSLCLVGQWLRSTAMYQAGRSFTHLIAEEKAAEHVLITHGVYAYARHPSYLGWFWWSIGTQLLLANPVCTVLYTLASWRFFAGRIPVEEHGLLCFFGEQYWDYCARVKTWIPFIDSPLHGLSRDTAVRMRREYEKDCKVQAQRQTRHESAQDETTSIGLHNE